MVDRGRVIFLNGTSSAGKTTLARAIQEIAPVPYLYTGLDSQFAMVPPKWGGGRGGPLSADGFRYVTSREDGHPVTTIMYGPGGLRMLSAMHLATAALTTGGNNVIVDEMLLAPELLTSWINALSGIDVLFVGVHCSLAILEERERQRRRRPGLARSHLRTVHSHGRPYDMQVDTSAIEAEQLAAQVLARREQGPPPVGFTAGGAVSRGVKRIKERDSERRHLPRSASAMWSFPPRTAPDLALRRSSSPTWPSRQLVPSSANPRRPT